MSLPDFHSMLILLNAAPVWSGMTGIAGGAALGHILRFFMNWKRRGDLKLYVSLWEWARQRELDQASTISVVGNGKPRQLHANRIQKYYRQMRRYAWPEKSLFLACGFIGLAALSVCLAVFFRGREATQPLFWIGGLPVAMVIACLTMTGPWLARMVALLLVIGTLGTVWFLGGLQPTSGVTETHLAWLRFENDPIPDGRAKIVLFDRQGVRLGELPWTAPWAGVSVQAELCQYRIPLDLFIREQTAWKLVGLTPNIQGSPAASRKPQWPLPTMRWLVVNSAPVGGKNLAGSRFSLNLRTDDLPVLYVLGPIADN